MHGLDTGTTQLQLDVEREIRGIDADEHIGFFIDEGLDQQLASGQQLAQPPQHFHQPHHRQTLHREIGLHALGFHQRAAHADETNIGMTCFQGTHQAGSEDIAGCLASDQCDT